MIMQNTKTIGQTPGKFTGAVSDEQILDQYFARDEQAVRLTTEKYGAYCHSIAGNLLADGRDAEECVSDTWFKAWNSIPPARPLNFKAYLGRITRNEALSLIRKDSAKKRASARYAVSMDELAECLTTEDNPVEKAVDNGEIAACINEYLDGQPTEKRSMFVMRYFYLDSIEDIAADLDMRKSRVKTTLFRMRAELKIHLIRRGLEEERAK